jgi:hypothetical protein
MTAPASPDHLKSLIYKLLPKHFQLEVLQAKMTQAKTSEK